MADTKASQLEELAYTALVADDDFVVVDASDTSMAASGTTKRVSLVDTGTWLPELQGSVSNPSSVTYSARAGEYTRIGDVVFFALQMTVTSFTGGSGSARVTLPFTARTNPGIVVYRNDVSLHNVTISDASRGITLGVVRGTNFAVISITRNNNTELQIELSNFGSNAIIQAAGFYFV